MGLVIIVVNTWFSMLTGQNRPVQEHYWGLALVLLTAVMYFIKFRYGILMTGISLLLGLFGLVVFLPLKSVTYYGITIGGVEIRTPYIVPTIFVLILLYAAVNGSSLVKFYDTYVGNRKAGNQDQKV